MLCNGVEVLSFRFRVDGLPEYPGCEERWRGEVERVVVFHEYHSSLLIRYPFRGRILKKVMTSFSRQYSGS